MPLHDGCLQSLLPAAVIFRMVIAIIRAGARQQFSETMSAVVADQPAVCFCRLHCANLAIQGFMPGKACTSLSGCGTNGKTTLGYDCAANNASPGKDICCVTDRWVGVMPRYSDVIMADSMWRNKP